MPRLLKRLLPPSRNPLIGVPDSVLSVVEYATLGFVLTRRGLSAEHKLMTTLVLGIVYETYILNDYGDFGQKQGGDLDMNLTQRSS